MRGMQSGRRSWRIGMTEPGSGSIAPRGERDSRESAFHRVGRALVVLQRQSVQCSDHYAASVEEKKELTWNSIATWLTSSGARSRQA